MPSSAPAARASRQRRTHPSATENGRDAPPALCERAVVAVTGSIGALWAAQFVLELRTGHHVRDVRVVVSESAGKMVTPAALRAVSGSPVLGGLFDADAPFSIGHVQLAADADVLIVMPATANIIGKTANGIADDAVSASIMAAACPVVFVPNMNDVMWQRPAVQRNIRTLVRDGYHVVPPVEGVVVSTGRSAVGGMPDFDTILAAVRRVLTRAARNQRGTRATTSGQSRDRAKAAKPARRRRRRSS